MESVNRIFTGFESFPSEVKLAVIIGSIVTVAAVSFAVGCGITITINQCSRCVRRIGKNEKLPPELLREISVAQREMKEQLDTLHLE